MPNPEHELTPKAGEPIEPPAGLRMRSCALNVREHRPELCLYEHRNFKDDLLHAWNGAIFGFVSDEDVNHVVPICLKVSFRPETSLS